jgi:hypothetical protein
VLDTSNGRVTANTANGAFNFEDPLDANGDNVYEQQIELSDGTNTVTETITVTITDVDEPPEFAQLPEFQLNENQTGVIVTFTGVDPEGATVGDYQLFEVSKLGEVINADRLVNAFSVDATTGALSVVIPFDAETEGTQDPITVTVSATDGVKQGFGGVTIRIVDLPSQIGDAVRITGENTLNIFGNTAATVGDLDGDGVDEVFVALQTDLGGVDSGFLLWGAALRDALALQGADLQAGALTAFERVAFTGDDRQEGTGRISHLTGVEVGDVDSDGRDDLLILMRRDKGSIDPADEDSGPIAYLVWGSALERGITNTFSLTDLAAEDGVALGGLARGAATDVVGTGADFDGDNQSDVVLGLATQNRSIVIFGDALSAVGGNLDLATATNTQVVEIRSELAERGLIQQTGGRVAVINDLNGDGVSELVISGEGLDPSFASGVLVVDGMMLAEAKGKTSIVNISANANDTRVIEATLEEVRVGGLATTGDFDADGLADIAMGHRANFGVFRVATVVFGSAIANAFGDSEELDLNAPAAGVGVAFSDDGSSDAQTVDDDPVRVAWIGDADGLAGDELMVAVPNASPLGRFDAGYMLVFSGSNVAAAGSTDVRIDSNAPDATLVRVLQGYGTGVRTGRELFVIDLNSDTTFEIGTASRLAGSESVGIDNGGLVVISGTVVSDAIAQPEGASDLANTVIIEAP